MKAITLHIEQGRLISVLCSTPELEGIEVVPVIDGKPVRTVRPNLDREIESYIVAARDLTAISTATAALKALAEMQLHGESYQSFGQLVSNWERAKHYVDSEIEAAQLALQQVNPSAAARDLQIVAEALVDGGANKKMAGQGAANPFTTP
ncbi:MAG: hypothetical protein JSS20_18305, partial [Proteobacteria bacterium]|nr:hypothetical protein [Pseudomonadota bacterium]